MGKRGNDRQITKDDRDEEMPVEAGTWAKAGDSEVRRRRIVRVRRAPKHPENPGGVNPFAGVSLLAPQRPGTETNGQAVANTDAGKAMPTEQTPANGKDSEVPRQEVGEAAEKVPQKEVAQEQLTEKKSSEQPEAQPAARPEAKRGFAAFANSTPPFQGIQKEAKKPAPVPASSNNAVSEQPKADNPQIGFGAVAASAGGITGFGGGGGVSPFKALSEVARESGAFGSPFKVLESSSSGKDSAGSIPTPTKKAGYFGGIGSATSAATNPVPVFGNVGGGSTFASLAQGHVESQTGGGGSSQEVLKELPKEVEKVTGEEDEKTLLAQEAVLFCMEGELWRQRGKGVLRLNVNSKTGVARLIMRQKGTLRLFLNASVYPKMKVSKTGANSVTFSCVNGADEAEEKVAGSQGEAGKAGGESKGELKGEVKGHEGGFKIYAVRFAVKGEAGELIISQFLDLIDKHKNESVAK